MGGHFELWLETEHIAEDITDFCNVEVTLTSGERYGLNVWTYAFFRSLDPRDTGGEVPDLLVADLSRTTITAGIVDLLIRDGIPAHYRVV